MARGERDIEFCLSVVELGISSMALYGQILTKLLVLAPCSGSRLCMMTRSTKTLSECMNKMLGRDIRHLPLVEDGNKVVGIISIKDLTKSVLAEKDQCIQSLASFATGAGGHFVV